MLQPAAPRPAERTIFADEFSGRSIDRSKWNVIVTGRTVNNEQQAYVDSPDVLSVVDGSLVIRPRYRKGFTTRRARVRLHLATVLQRSVGASHLSENGSASCARWKREATPQ